MLKELDGSNQSIVSYTYGDDLISQSRAGAESYYLYDGHGSTRSLTDSSGNTLNTYAYNAYGVLIDSTGSAENSYLYAGEQFDANLSNYYLRARYYDPSIGRFTTLDTWMGVNSDPVTLHKYAYGNLDPINHSDPSGMYSLAEMQTVQRIRTILGGIRDEMGMQLTSFILGGGSGEDLAEDTFTSLLMAFGPAALLRLAKMAGKHGRKVDELAEFCNSFVAGTSVATEDGQKSIEKIEIGDKVWAFNEESGELELQEVVHLILGEGEKDLVNITLESGETIRATSGHPFYVDGEWVDAGDLVIGNFLYNKDGQATAIKAIQSATLDTSVYNLSVDMAHTYYVGRESVLSHNASKCKSYPRDYATANTKNYGAVYNSEREARNLARTKIGRDPVKVGENKYRSRDGKWQYRGKPEDLTGHNPSDTPHIHIERLDPNTGEVLENWHLRW